MAPVVNLADTDYVLIASAKSGIKTLDDLRALALKQPGQRTFASAGVGTVHHLGFEQLNQLLGISMVHVPFKGGPPGAAEVAATITATTTAVEAVVSRVRIAAAVARPQRSSVRPCAALKPAVKAVPVVAPAQANKMMVWTPVNNK